MVAQRHAAEGDEPAVLALPHEHADQRGRVQAAGQVSRARADCQLCSAQDRAAERNLADLAGVVLGVPERAVRALRDHRRRVDGAVAAGSLHDGNVAARGDLGELALTIGDPQLAVGASRDRLGREGVAQTRGVGQPDVRRFVAVMRLRRALARDDPVDAVVADVGHPQIAVGTGRDPLEAEALQAEG